MTRLFKLQFLGPLAVFFATLCAELAVRALDYAPSSELLWFVNLRMFGIFQRSYAMLNEVVIIRKSSAFRAFSSSASLCRYFCWHVMASSLGAGYHWLWQVT